MKLWKCLFLAWTASLSTAWAGPAANIRDSLIRSYVIDADFTRIDQGQISATLSGQVQNSGTSPLRELQFILYPNRFQKELPNLNDLNFRRIYPAGFSRGALEIEEFTFSGGAAQVLEQVSHPLLPKGTLVRARLKEPLPPGKDVSFQIRYRLTIPEKFGSFGRYKGKTTLSGGWYPFVVSFRDSEGFRPDDFPPRAEIQLRWTANQQVWVGGKVYAPSQTPISWKASGVRNISLALADSLTASQVAGERETVTVLVPSKEKGAIPPFRELVVRWLEYVERQPELRQFGSDLFLIQAPIRDALVTEGEGATFVSDRAFKLWKGLGQYHSVPIIRGLFYQLLLPEVSRRESSEDYHWVASALAWHWTQSFMQEQTFTNVDARTLGPIRLLSFLPSIDQLLYTPQFAFFDVFYDFVYSFDPVRDDVLRFGHQRPSGRTIFAHLEDEVGSEKADEIAHRYTENPNQPFRALTGEIVGRSFDDRFAQWTAPRPEVNYVLQKHRVRKSDGMYQHEVTVTRETDANLVEPVELVATLAGGSRELLRWDGAGNSHTFEFTTKAPIKILEIDPRGRLLETRLSDNRKPAKYKMVLTQALVGFDFNASKPDVFLATQIRKSYGGSDRYNLSALYSGDTYGFSVGYSRLFGRLVDRLRLSHAMSVSFGFRRLDDDFGVTVDPATGTAASFPLSPSGEITTLSLGYSTGSLLSYTNPLEGGYAGAGVTWGTHALGGDFDYVTGTLGASWIFPIRKADHLLAFQGTFGTSGPDSIPSQVQFSLGGISGIRGLSLDDDRFRGRHMLQFSGEYRHLFLKDLDWNLGVFRIRDIQGALFTDAGHVTDTVQETVDRLALGSTRSSGIGDLFDVRNFSTDVGYGLRFLIEYLGVNPGLLRFDVAKSLSEADENVRFYFGVTQSF